MSLTLGDYDRASGSSCQTEIGFWDSTLHPGKRPRNGLLLGRKGTGTQGRGIVLLSCLWLVHLGTCLNFPQSAAGRCWGPNSPVLKLCLLKERGVGTLVVT